MIVSQVFPTHQPFQRNQKMKSLQEKGKMKRSPQLVGQKARLVDLRGQHHLLRLSLKKLKLRTIRKKEQHSKLEKILRNNKMVKNRKIKGLRSPQ